MCNCREDIEVGEYKNQIQVGYDFLPNHMRYYKSKTNGDPNSICIDLCILKEIIELWDLGITTTGCCCGHNKVPSYIGVIDNDIKKMKDLGYKVHFNHMRPYDEDSFNPKSIIKTEDDAQSD